MPNFLITFLILVLSFSLIITVIGEIAFKGVNVDMDSQYYDRNGDHIYYDRSLIKKKLFRQKYLHLTDLRTIKSLLRRKANSSDPNPLEYAQKRKYFVTAKEL